jgi:hypothetical protein
MSPFDVELVGGERHEMFAKVLWLDVEPICWPWYVFSNPGTVVCHQQTELIPLSSITGPLKTLSKRHQICHISIVEFQSARNRIVDQVIANEFIVNVIRKRKFPEQESAKAVYFDAYLGFAGRRWSKDRLDSRLKRCRRVILHGVYAD